MAKKPQNSGKKWEQSDIKKLEKLIDGNTPTGLIAYNLGRSESSIYNKAQQLNLSLQPTNKPPYDRKVSEAKKNKK